MRHGHEVVLTADPADHAIVIEAVADRGTVQGHHHAGVDEAGVFAMQAIDFLVPVELVDTLHAFHIDQPAVLVVQKLQPVVKFLAAEEKAPVNDVGVVQFVAETKIVDAFPVIEIVQVIRKRFTFRGRDDAIDVGQVRPKNAEFLQVGEILLGYRLVDSLAHQNEIERRRRYGLVDLALVDESLDDQVVINLALDDAGLV